MGRRGGGRTRSVVARQSRARAPVAFFLLLDFDFSPPLAVCSDRSDEAPVQCLLRSSNITHKVSDCNRDACLSPAGLTARTFAATSDFDSLDNSLFRRAERQHRPPRESAQLLPRPRTRLKMPKATSDQFVRQANSAIPGAQAL